MRLRVQKRYIHSNRACVLLFLILPVVMVQTIIHTHVGIALGKTGIHYIALPYLTPRDLRGRCLYCFNYSGKPGITPV